MISLYINIYYDIVYLIYILIYRCKLNNNIEFLNLHYLRVLRGYSKKLLRLTKLIKI